MTRLAAMFFMTGAAALSFASGASAQDAEAGEQVFNQCRACHVVGEEQNRVGPHLVGVIGRTPGTVEGYSYSDAMTAYGEENVWDEETLTEYLADPRGVVEGTKMAFAGLKTDDDIANVIAYIAENGGEAE